VPTFAREVFAAAVVGWLLVVLPLSLLILSAGGSLLGCLWVAGWSTAIAVAWGVPTVGLNFLLRARPRWTRAACAFAMAGALVAVPVVKAAMSYDEWRGSGPAGLAFAAAAAFPVCVTVVFIGSQAAIRAAIRAASKSALPQPGSHQPA
jgi:hypothetical protein